MINWHILKIFLPGQSGKGMKLRTSATGSSLRKSCFISSINKLLISLGFLALRMNPEEALTPTMVFPLRTVKKALFLLRSSTRFRPHNCLNSNRRRPHHHNCNNHHLCQKQHCNWCPISHCLKKGSFSRQ